MWCAPHPWHRHHWRRYLTDDEKRRVQASYYTSTEFTDKNMGIVLSALEKSGQAENTIVVYIGDHGYMLGQHGRFEKHCSYEPAIRSPLLIRYPKTIRAGSRTDAIVENVDFGPLMLDFAGVPTPDYMQGRSFRGIVGRADPLAVGKTPSEARIMKLLDDRSLERSPVVANSRMNRE